MLFYIQNDPWLLSIVGNHNRMLQNKFFVVCKCLGGWDTRHVSNAPGGVLAAGIDLHITTNHHCLEVFTFFRELEKLRVFKTF